MTRIINYSNENGSHEGIYITEDLESIADDFIPPSCACDNDVTYDINMPLAFPIENNFRKV